jgi:hypothetical protein
LFLADSPWIGPLQLDKGSLGKEIKKCSLTIRVLVVASKVQIEGVVESLGSLKPSRS